MNDTDPALVAGDEGPINDSPNTGVDPEPAAPQPEDVPVTTQADDPDSPYRIFKVWEKRAEDEVALLLEDGRVFIAKIGDEIKGLRKGSNVTISHDGLNSDGVPTNAVVDGPAADSTS